MRGKGWTRRGALHLGGGLLAASSAWAAEPALRLDGNQVLRGGEATRLRGVAMGDALLARAGRSDEDYAVLADVWRANVVRLSLHPYLWRARRAEAARALEAEIAAARRHGLAVIVEWHAIGWPGGAFEAPQAARRLPADAYDTDLDLAEDFWGEIAARFGGEQQVIFEIWNEPVRLEAPEGAWGADWHDLRPIWSRLLATIRRRAGNLVLATGGAWASDLTGVRDAPLDDPMVGYAWHVYPGTAGGSPDRLAALLDALPRTRSVFVTEWGFEPAPAGHLQGSADGFGRMLAERFLDRFALNWTAWCWQPDWRPPLIAPNWRTPTEAGAFVRALLSG